MQKNQTLILACVLLLISCQSQSEHSSMKQNKMSTTSVSADMASYEESEMTKTASGQEFNEHNSTASVDRKIIKTADYRIQVEDVKASYSVIKPLVEKNKGYINNMNETNNRYEINNRMTIRVPQENFDQLLIAISEISVFEDYKRITASDVTAEYLDVETRLESKKLVRDRYIDVLKNKAKIVEEIILAQETIRRIQEEIEAKEGRLKYLKNQSSLSTINLDMYQRIDRPNVPKRTYFSKIKRGFENGWDLCLDIILGLVNIWPIVILLILFFWKRSWILSKIRRK